MKIIFTILVLSMAFSRADFADDQYANHPDILLRIVTAAQNDEHLKSHVVENTVLYLRTAEYIGPLNASFGTVHVAQLSYVRSVPRGSKNPARGHTYVIFLDDNMKILGFWEPDLPLKALSVDGTKLVSDGEVVLDYAHLPKSGEVLLDGKVMGVPKGIRK